MFPQSKVRIVVEGDRFGEEDAEGAFLPLVEGQYYHFVLLDATQRLSKKSSFVAKSARHGSLAPGTAVGYGRLH